MGATGSGQLAKMCNQIAIAGVVQGLADSLLNPIGARYLEWRLGAARSKLHLVEGAPHGLLWDERFGESTAREIADFLMC